MPAGARNSNTTVAPAPLLLRTRVTIERSIETIPKPRVSGRLSTILMSVSRLKKVLGPDPALVIAWLIGLNLPEADPQTLNRAER